MNRLITNNIKLYREYNNFEKYLVLKSHYQYVQLLVEIIVI